MVEINTLYVNTKSLNSVYYMPY